MTLINHANTIHILKISLKSSKIFGKMFQDIVYSSTRFFYTNLLRSISWVFNQGIKIPLSKLVDFRFKSILKQFGEQFPDQKTFIWQKKLRIIILSLLLVGSILCCAACVLLPFSKMYDYHYVYHFLSKGINTNMDG